MSKVTYDDIRKLQAKSVQISRIPQDIPPSSEDTKKVEEFLQQPSRMYRFLDSHKPLDGEVETYFEFIERHAKFTIPELVAIELKRNRHSVDGTGQCIVCNWRIGTTLNIPMCTAIDGEVIK